MNKIEDPNEHERFMKEAIGASIKYMREGNGGPFGAVIVLDGEIIATGYNQVTSTNDPTAHAEIVAIRNACKKLAQFSLAECKLYTSCEPCPMCLSAIYWARISQVHYANTRADAAAIGFDDNFIYQQISLPLSQRKLVLNQLMRSEAQIAFSEWKNKMDKTLY